MSEPLKCGPCSRCKHKAEIMEFQPHGTLVESREPSEVHQNDAYVEQSLSVDTNIDEAAGNSKQVEGVKVASICDNVRVTKEKNNNLSWACEMSPTEVANLQAVDINIKPIYEGLMSASKPPWAYVAELSPETRHYWLI
ncbi:hypothetical protein DPMN_184700 [Dreissena polymorpha]|uniref:Uncharacterized protein n=1 Tax=Dreissena polymorpha TaxID=45954 RepID=A0A9D4DK28_DREPO|nr:hypothetical protein DPMN_184700 [Dreissena polymorpha]